ncbi:MAG TPA: DUF192 domain-containing protein [Candidatus Dojkabacteria bacterium]|nr:DUF192 domain-containing protein [Candidatus Dojkabacteria bacterium]
MIKKVILLILFIITSAFLVILGFKLFTPDSQKQQPGTIPLKITSQNKVKAELFVEIADTPDEQSRGLMYRTSLEKNHGMLFIFQDSQPLYFFMKNTYIPLDIIFINSEFTIIDIHENVPALQESPLISSSVPSKYALEIASGSISSNGIRLGDKIFFEIP